MDATDVFPCGSVPSFLVGMTAIHRPLSNFQLHVSVPSKHCGVILFGNVFLCVHYTGAIMSKSTMMDNVHMETSTQTLITVINPNINGFRVL